MWRGFFAFSLNKRKNYILVHTQINLGEKMGDSEHEISEKIGKLTAKSIRVTSEVKGNFAKIQKLNADSLKKLEEMMQDSEKELEKLEQKIAKSKNLAHESKHRLKEEIDSARTQTKQRYKELKGHVASIIGLTTPTA